MLWRQYVKLCLDHTKEDLNVGLAVWTYTCNCVCCVREKVNMLCLQSQWDITAPRSSRCFSPVSSSQVWPPRIQQQRGLISQGTSQLSVCTKWHSSNADTVRYCQLQVLSAAAQSFWRHTLSAQLLSTKGKNKPCGCTHPKTNLSCSALSAGTTSSALVSMTTGGGGG